MDRTSCSSLRRAALEINFVRLKIGSGTDRTSSKNISLLNRAYQMLMEVLLDEKPKKKMSAKRKR